MGGLFRGIFAPASLKLGDRSGVDEGSHLFRGIFAPASLKQHRLRAQGARNPGPLPGHLRPGLIEARPTRGRSSRTNPPLPGHLRPGLIEATEKEIPLTKTTPLPGHLRPGLIEAMAAWSFCFQFVLFRGIFAPASLKQHHVGLAHVSEGSGLFRGIFAPASLKRPTPCVERSHRGDQLFRGILAPASLKPDVRRCVRAIRAGSSGASSPRPH